MTELMLTADEVVRLTGKRRRQAQTRELTRLGIRFHVNSCDEVLVAREIAEKFLGVTRKTAEKDLNWLAMRGIGIVSRRET